jgi:protein-L-isoaspartate(D-aspartate) O-methyltransferase
MDDATLARKKFATAMGMVARAPGGRVSAAFAEVPREQFLGNGPWPIFSFPSNYQLTVTDNPSEIYRDVAVGLVPEKLINNGQPSLHAFCLGILDPRPGETAVHVGAGGGYYTAILANLIERGVVHAYEIEPDLADLARQNLRNYANVRVHLASAVDSTLPECDVIYVNAGATHPLDAWLDALRPDGRLMFPLTCEDLTGGMVLLTPHSEYVFGARILMPVAFIPCTGARDKAKSSVLAKAFRDGGWQSVRSLRRGNEPDASSWFSAGTCWFSTRDPDV